MKKMRTFAYALIAALVGVSFVACSDDDNPDTPKPTVEKRLAAYSDYEFDYTIEYDASGRISKVTAPGAPEDETTSITYYSGSISVSRNANTSGTYTLKDGLITEWRRNNGSIWKFKYNQGRLIEYTTPNGNIISYTWEDGDIIAQEIKYTDGEHAKIKCNYTNNYDYGAICSFIQYNSTFYHDLCTYLVMQGYFGKTPAHLPSSTSGDWGSDGVETDSFTYRFDEDGYPISMDYDDSRELDFTWVKK